MKTKRRKRLEIVEQQVGEKHEFENIGKVKELVAEFIYQPGNCEKAYCIAVLMKELETYRCA